MHFAGKLAFSKSVGVNHTCLQCAVHTLATESKAELAPAERHANRNINLLLDMLSTSVLSSTQLEHQLSVMRRM